MPQVRDPSLGTARNLEAFAHPLHLPFNSIPSTVQHVRIEVSLQRDLVPDALPSLGGIDAPIESKNVVSRVFGQEREGLASTFGEECHWRGRYAEVGQTGTDAGGDVD